MSVAAVFALALVALLSSAGNFPRLAALVVAALALLVWTIRRSYADASWLIVALIVEETLPYINIIPLDPQNRWFLRYPLLIPLCLPALWIVWRSKILWQDGFRYILAFFAWGAVTVVYSLNSPISAGRLLPDILVFAALTVAALNVRSQGDVQKLLGRFLLGCGVLQVLTVIAWFFFPANLTHMIDDQGLLRFTGIGTDANAVGSLMLATIGAGVAYWPAAQGWRRICLAAIMVSAVSFAALADSRSESAAAAIGCAAYAVWKYRFKGAALCAAFLCAAMIAYEMLGPHLQIYLNRDLTTLTGRTEAWDFELVKLEQKPLLGYGYEVEGEIFQDRYFTNWQQFWDQGANTALHDSYLTIAIGMGLPALALFLYAFVAPWVGLFRGSDDLWNLKPLAFLVILPALLLGIDESGLSEPRSVRGLLIFLSWILAVRYETIRARETRDGKNAIKIGWRRAFASLAGACAIAIMLCAGTAAAQSRMAPPRHFPTLPLRAPLPSGAQCAAWVAPTPETIPENIIANHTRPNITELAFMRAHGYHFATLDSERQYRRIDGDYQGSTYMILRWAACKYGIDEDVMRAQAWQESYWKQAEHGDRRWEPKDCAGGSVNLWNYAGCAECCWQSWSILQTKVVPYQWMTWPAIHESTAFAADYRGADQRSCMDGYYRSYFTGRRSHDGHLYWRDISAALANPADQTALDVVLRGCIGMHYSGSWYDAGAREYIGDVWGWIAKKPWRHPNRARPLSRSAE